MFRDPLIWLVPAVVTPLVASMALLTLASAKEPEAVVSSRSAPLHATWKSALGEVTEQTPVDVPMKTRGRTVPARVPRLACRRLTSPDLPTERPPAPRDTSRVITAG